MFNMNMHCIHASNLLFISYRSLAWAAWINIYTVIKFKEMRITARTPKFSCMLCFYKLYSYRDSYYTITTVYCNSNTGCSHSSSWNWGQSSFTCTAHIMYSTSDVQMRKYISILFMYSICSYWINYTSLSM